MGAYTYDTSGQSYFFFLTVLLLVLVPFTYIVVKGGKDRAAARVPYPCAGWNEKAPEIKRVVATSRGRLSKSHIALAIGWLAFAFVVQRASIQEADGLLYDPYKILGVALGATEKEISKHFKKAARKFHPDKISKLDNQTKEEASNYFVELTKAYKSLTDVDIRKNFELFGHPDGKQEFSQGIALPSWLVESKNVVWVIGAYALVLGVMLPYLVGRWWYGARKITKDGVLNSTAATFFRGIKEEVVFPQLLDLLASADEFAVDPALITLRKSMPKTGVDEYARLASTVREGADGKAGWEGYASWPNPRKRARVLISAHMLRIPINDKTLLREKLATIALALPLTSGLSSVALAFNWLSASIAIIHLQQFLLQAVHPSSSPLLQLPYLTDEIATAARQQGVLSVADFGRLGAGEVEKLLPGMKDEEKKAAFEVAKHWPVVEVVSAKFQVIGEKVVTSGAIVSFTVKIRIAPPCRQSPKLPAANGVVATPTPVEGDDLVVGVESSIDELIGRRKPGEDGIEPTPLAHAPLFPKDRKPSWSIFIGDHKLNRVFVVPHKFTDMGLSDAGAVRTVRMTFPAPPGPGLYTFQCYVMSDSFVGTDIQKDLRMKVEPPPEDGAGLDDEDDISEPDEDTIAGQMALMKGQPVRRPRDSDDDDDDSDDDTSGTDESEEEETSDSDSD